MKYLIAALVLFPLACHADGSCPWINKATALGAMGADEDSSRAKASEICTSNCSFIYDAGKGIRELRITVEQINNAKQVFEAYKTRCASAEVSLQAVGNEAVMCAASSGPGRFAEQVIGRVRDQVFTITLSGSGSDDFSERESLIQRAEFVAEQVSGNLF